MTEAANGAALDTPDEPSGYEEKLAMSGSTSGENIPEEAIREALSRILERAMFHPIS